MGFSSIYMCLVLDVGEFLQVGDDTDGLDVLGLHFK